METFEHPRRLAKNAPGPFYTMGGCLACDMPESKAPELLAPLEGDNYETFFARQPRTTEEIEHACEALESCCVSDLRYGGKDRKIIERLGNSPEFCDHVLDVSGEIIVAVSLDGNLRPEFDEVVGRQHLARRNRFQATIAEREVTWRLPWHELDAVLPPTPARRYRDRLVVAFSFILIGVWLLWAYVRAAT